MSKGPRPAETAGAVRLGRALSVSLLILLATGGAEGRDLWSSADGSSSFELQAFYKTFATGLRMPHGLTEASELIPLWGGTAAETARTWGTFRYRERVELSAGWQIAALEATDEALLGTSVLGGGVSATGTSPASRRLVDLDPVLLEREHLLLQHNLDLLAFTVRSSFADVTVGRQVLSWGSGRLWNPTDLLSPFGPTDVDREVRRGIDAVRVSVGLAATAQLDLLWLPQQSARDHGAVARGQFNLHGFDIAPSAAKYLRDVVVGLDTAGDAGPLGVHGEVAWVRALDRNAEGDRDAFVRGVVGVDWRPAESLVLIGEYHFNGWGAGDPSGYLEVLSSARVVGGEVFGAGRHYAGVVAAWQISPLLTTQATALANLGDPSVLLVPSLEWWARQKLLVRAGGYLPVGRRPDPERSQAPLGLRSEFGASAYALFAQVALYL